MYKPYMTTTEGLCFLKKLLKYENKNSLFKDSVEQMIILSQDLKQKGIPFEIDQSHDGAVIRILDLTKNVCIGDFCVNKFTGDKLEAFGFNIPNYDVKVCDNSSKALEYIKSYDFPIENLGYIFNGFEVFKFDSFHGRRANAEKSKEIMLQVALELKNKKIPFKIEKTSLDENGAILYLEGKNGEKLGDIASNYNTCYIVEAYGFSKIPDNGVKKVFSVDKALDYFKTDYNKEYGFNLIIPKKKDISMNLEF